MDPYVLDSKPNWIQVVLQKPLYIITGALLIFGALFLNEANFRASEVLSAAADWQTLCKLGICMACGIYSILLYDYARLKNLGVPAIGMTMFCLWAFLCALKSVNVSYSLTCCTVLFCMFVFADCVSRRFGQRAFVLTSLVVLYLFLVCCWIARLVMPGLNAFDPLIDSVADSKRFAGLSHPNGTAAIAAATIGLTFVASNSGYLKWKWGAPLVIFAFGTLYLTGSRTWLFASLLVTAYATMRHFGLLTKLTVGSLCVVLGAALCLFLLSTWNASSADKALAGISRSGNSEEIYSLTGRSDLWAFVIKKIGSSPIFGYGYGCQRFVIGDEHYWPTRHAHNVLLNATLGTGLIGGALLAGVFLCQFFRMFVDRTDFPDTILLLILAGGFSENPLFNPLPGALTLLFFVSLFWRENQAKVD